MHALQGLASIVFLLGLSTPDVDAWLVKHGLDVADGPVVGAALARRARWRTRAAIAAASLAAITFAVVGEPSSVAWTPLACLVGWLAGGVGAEVAHLRATTPDSRGPRVASTSPRTLTSHLSAGTRWLQLGLPMVAATSIALGLAGDHLRGPSGRSAVAVASVAFAVSLAALVLQRRILRRPAVAASNASLAAGEALRRDSLRTLAGAACGAQLLAIAHVQLAVATSTTEDWPSTFAYCAVVVAGVLALPACFELTTPLRIAWPWRRNVMP